VGIVDAGLAEAEALRLLLGREYPVDFDPAEVLPFVGFREQSSTDRRIRRTHLLLTRELTVLGTPQGMAEADTSESDWLRAAFSDLPDAVPADEGTSPTDCLTQIADSVMTDMIKSDSQGDSLQCVNNTWSTRSFTQSNDLFYVRQAVTTKVGSEVGLFGVVFAVSQATNTLATPATAPLVVQAAPGTTQNTSQYTSGVNFGVGGTAGYKVNPVYLVSPSLAITDSTTTTVDPTQIANQVDPSTGAAGWQYLTNCGNNCTLNGKTYSYTENWIWAVPFSAYGASEDSISYDSNLFALYDDGANQPQLSFTLTSCVPLPFNETVLGPPTVTAVSPATAGSGDTITITGTNFYLINDVILGGNDVPAANYQVTESNTTLSVDIPSGQPQGAGQSVVVSTQEGLSNANVTITIN
jgi:hypothetical protein